MSPRLALLLLASLLAAGCGGSSGPSSSTGEASSSEAPAPELDVSIDDPAEGDRTTRPTLEVSGTVSPPDAEVDVNGASMEVSGEQWSGEVELDLGSNGLNAVATTDGTTDRATDTVDVTRRRTAAQRAAYRAAQRRKREQRIAALRASAEAIDTELLQKNPDRYTGETVVISGEVFQIQEDGADGNFLLMNTGCETEYEIRICDGPTVHVTYEGSNDKTEDDLVTVYGTVAGGLDYDTAIGGSNYVGSIEAAIVE